PSSGTMGRKTGTCRGTCCRWCGRGSFLAEGMAVRRTAVSAAVWALAWGVGMFIWARHATTKNLGGSWVVGIPFFLPFGMLAWGAIRGLVRAGAAGALAGLALYGTLGVFGFFALPLAFVSPAAGVMAGMILGVVAGAVEAQADE